MGRETHTHFQLKQKYAAFSEWEKTLDSESLSEPNHSTRPYIHGMYKGLDQRSTFPVELLDIVQEANKILTLELIGIHKEILRHYPRHLKTVQTFSRDEQFDALGEMIGNVVAKRITHAAKKYGIEFVWGLKFAYDASGEFGMPLIFLYMPHLFVDGIEPKYNESNKPQFRLDFGEKGTNDSDKDSTTHCPFHSFSQILANEVDIALGELSLKKLDSEDSDTAWEAEITSEHLAAYLSRHFIVTVNKLTDAYDRAETRSSLLQLITRFLNITRHI